MWSRNYGGIDHDVVSLDVMADGDLLMTGLERRGAEEVAFVTRLDGQGQERWIETLDYASNQAATDALLTDDGAVLIAGWRYSAGPPYAEVTLTRFTGDGLMVWRQQLGSANGEERALSLTQVGQELWVGGWFEGDEPWDLGTGEGLSAETRGGFVAVVQEPQP